MRYLFACCLLALFASLSAQSGAFGLRLGASYFQQRAQLDPITVDLDHRIGLSGGVYYQAELTPYLVLQPELAFTQRGGKFVSEDGFTSIESGPGGTTTLVTDIVQRIRYNYLEAPLLVKGQYGNDRLTGYLQAGPSFGYLLSANEQLEAGNEIEDFDVAFGEDDGINRFETALVLGGGVVLPLGEQQLLLDVRYVSSLSNLTDAEEDQMAFGDGAAKLTNRGWQLSVGYQWPFGR